MSSDTLLIATSPYFSPGGYASHWFDASLRLTPSGLARKCSPGAFFSPAFIGTCSAPSLGILVRNVG